MARFVCGSAPVRRTGKSTGLTRDDVLDNATLFWLTNTTISASRLIWEGFAKTDLGPKNITIPVALSVFPDEVYHTPRTRAQWAYPNLIHYNQLDKGGHFAAWEQPKLLVDEVRAGLNRCGNSRRSKVVRWMAPDLRVIHRVPNRQRTMR